jgi:hypothetical protein
MFSETYNLERPAAGLLYREPLMSLERFVLAADADSSVRASHTHPTPFQINEDLADCDVLLAVLGLDRLTKDAAVHIRC